MDALTLQVIRGEASPLATKMVKEEQTILFGTVENDRPNMDVLCIYPDYGTLPPGDGAAECVYDPTTYVWLPRKFRFILSDQCVLAVPVIYKGASYPSIWHACMGAKYYYAGSRATDPVRKFQLFESIQAFSVLPSVKPVPVDILDIELKGWNWAKSRDAIFQSVILQCPLRQQALLATNDATLNYRVGSYTFHFKHLERIRSMLRSK